MNTAQNSSAGKHTPGPWHTSPMSPGFIKGNGIGNTIAKVDIDWPNWKANAELISKAPELLSQNIALLEKVNELIEENTRFKNMATRLFNDLSHVEDCYMCCHDSWHWCDGGKRALDDMKEFEAIESIIK